MLAILLLSALQLPQDTEQTAMHVSRSSGALNTDEPSSGEAELWVSPDGRVRECEVLAYAGAEEGVQTLCKSIVGARVEPARDQHGNTVHSIHRLTLTAHGHGGAALHAMQLLNRVKANQERPGFVIELSALPEELGRNPKVSVNLLIDKDGSLEICEPSSGSNERWSQVACNQLSSQQFEVRQSREGDAVRYIQKLVVGFET